jgi:type I restriction enzyme S subunit
LSSDWETVLLGNVAIIEIGRTPARKEPRYWTTSLERPFCTITDMAARSIDPLREGVTEAAEQEGKAKRVPAGALLMSFKLTIGRVGFAARDIFPNEAIAWIEPETGDLNQRFLAYALEAADYSALTGEAAKGATLNKDSLKRIELRLPPEPDQRRMADVLDSLAEAEEAAGAYLDGLSTARTAVARALISGTHVLPADFDVLSDAVE